MVELETIPALVRDTDDWERLDLALAENMARVDLNPVEEARACAMLVDDLGLTKQEVGRRVGRSRVAISNLIRLLELPEEALELIERGDADARATAARSCSARTTPRAAASRSTRATAAGRCARPSGARARLRVSLSLSRSASRREVHPDLAEALAAAEDALAAAFGRPVKVRRARRRLPRGARLRHARRGRRARRADPRRGHLRAV